MSDDDDLIRATIQIYFDGMYESSVEKALAAFHPDASITGYSNGVLQQMSTTDFAGFVARQQPSSKEKGELHVLKSCHWISQETRQ